MEFAEVPARNLADDIIQSRFKKGACAFRYGILEIEQAVSQTEFGCNEGERISSCLGSQCRRSAQSGIDLYYTVVFRLRVQGILDVALSDYAYVTDNPYCEFA